MTNTQPITLQLGEIQFDQDVQMLRDAEGNDIPLRPQSLSVLKILAQHSGTAVAKDKLIQSAWGAVHVTDDSLIQCIADIRRAIKDEAHEIVQTVPRTGYRLVATNAVTSASSRMNFSPKRIAAFAFAFVVLAMLAFWSLPQKPVFRSEQPSVAVLPFTNAGGDPENAYLTDGISKAITTNLSKFESLFVVSSHSAFKFRETDLSLGEIAQELGVRYIVSGDLQFGHDQSLMNAQLSDAQSGNTVWAESFSFPSAEIFAVQESLSATVASTLVARIEATTSQWAKSATPADLNAYELVLRSEPPAVDRQGLNAANELLDRAIELSPNFTLAHSLKAKNHLLLWRHSLAEDLDDALNQARVSAARAIDLDNNSYQAYHVLSQIDLYADQDHAQALANLTKALEINPNDADLMIRMATLTGFMNRDQEALEWIEKAIRQNPLHPIWYHWNAAFVYAVSDRYEDAIVSSKKALAVYQNSASIRRILIVAHANLDEWEDAKRYASEILDQFPDFRLSTHMRNSPFQDPAEKAEIWEVFKMAGLPE